MSPTKINLYRNARSTKKVKDSSPLGDLNSCIVTRNLISLDALNDAIKVHSQDVFTRQRKYFAKSWINNPTVKNKLKKDSNDTTEKSKQRCVVKIHKTGNSLLNTKINNHTSQPGYSVELSRIAKSQFLKMHVSEIFKDNTFLKCSQKIQNADDTNINLKNCTLDNNTDNVQTGKCNSTDAKFRVSAIDSPSAFKLDLSENIKLDKTSSNISDEIIRNNDHAISKYKYIRENKRSIASLKPLVNIEESAEDTTRDMLKPISVIEKETKLDEMKS